MGHVVSSVGVSTDPAKIAVIHDWFRPSSSRDLRRFLGFASCYRRFISSFAALAAPLHKLADKSSKFEWSPAAKDAFVSRHQKLCTAPVLTFPDFSKPFLLDTDASALAIGAVLSKHQDGQEHPVAFTSRTLSKSERHYSATRRDLIAVLHFVQHFRPYLLGRPFEIRTDHNALIWLNSFKDPSAQVARWLETLADFDYIVICQDRVIRMLCLVQILISHRQPLFAWLMCHRGLRAFLYLICVLHSRLIQTLVHFYAILSSHLSDHQQLSLKG